MEDLVLLIETIDFLFDLHVIDFEQGYIFEVYLSYKSVHFETLFFESLIEFVDVQFLLLRVILALFEDP